MTVEYANVMACVPVDTSMLPDVGIPVPEVTDLYMQERCEGCNQLIWVGPRQAIARELSTCRVYTLCYLCSVVAYHQSDGARLVNLGGGSDIEGSVIDAPDVAYCGMSPDDYPFTIEIFREDTGEVLWREVVTDAGAVEIPGFGGNGYFVGVRMIYPNGRIDTTLGSEAN